MLNLRRSHSDPNGCFPYRLDPASVVAIVPAEPSAAHARSADGSAALAIQTDGMTPKLAIGVDALAAALRSAGWTGSRIWADPASLPRPLVDSGAIVAGLVPVIVSAAATRTPAGYGLGVKLARWTLGQAAPIVEVEPAEVLA